MPKKKLFLVDGNSYGYRAYYAVRDLRTSAGRPTNAIYGFVAMLEKLLHEAGPDYLGVCFDLKGPTFRHEKFRDYKIQRKPMPEELRPQMETIKEIIRAYGVPVFEMSGYEADDLIATLASRFKENAQVYIVSGDKDMLQLVGRDVKIYNPQKEDRIVDEDTVMRRYRVRPEQISDFLALTGDSSDNIPGIPGIGEKSAAQLLAEFGTLERILAEAGRVEPEKRRALIKQFAAQAKLSKELTAVSANVPINATLDELRYSAPDKQRLSAIFRELEFKKFLKNLADPPPEAPRTDSDAVEITTVEAARELCGRLHGAAQIALYPECSGENDFPLRICLAAAENAVYAISTGSGAESGKIFAALQGLLSGGTALKIGHDLKHLCVCLHKLGVFLDGPFFDFMVAGYLLEPQSGTRSLEEIFPAYASDDAGRRPGLKIFFWIKERLLNELRDKELDRLFFDVEMPLVRVLASMEASGISVDRARLRAAGEKIDKKREYLTREIFKLSGGEFNLNSPKQLSEVLFRRLRLPVLKKGKTGPSTDVRVLQRLAAEHPLPGLLLEYREAAKLKSGYVDGLLELIDEADARIHASFNQTVTATGRLSSSTPNLQNIPVRTEMGKEIRAAFTARRADWKLLSADYSQIELRILAHLSGDERLIGAFRQEADVHRFTAALIFGVGEENVTEQMRDTAKRVNFGIIYGMGPYGLAQDLGISQEEARRFIEEYFLRYPGVKQYLQEQIEAARHSGYVKTLLNRRRCIPQIDSEDPAQRGFAERTAMNTPVQGTAADLIKAAMVEIYRRLRRERLRAELVLQVHDELVFDVPETELTTTGSLIKEVMEHSLELSVPIKVTMKYGTNWRDMEEMR